MVIIISENNRKSTLDARNQPQSAQDLKILVLGSRLRTDVPG